MSTVLCNEDCCRYKNLDGTCGADTIALRKRDKDSFGKMLCNTAKRPSIGNSIIRGGKWNRKKICLVCGWKKEPEEFVRSGVCKNCARTSQKS